MDYIEDKKNYYWIDALIESIGFCLVYMSFDSSYPKTLWLFRKDDTSRSFDSAVNIYYSSSMWSAASGHSHLHSWHSYKDFFIDLVHIVSFVYFDRRDGHDNKIEMQNPFFNKTAYELMVAGDLMCGER